MLNSGILSKPTFERIAWIEFNTSVEEKFFTWMWPPANLAITFPFSSEISKSDLVSEFAIVGVELYTPPLLTRLLLPAVGSSSTFIDCQLATLVKVAAVVVSVSM